MKFIQIGNVTASAVISQDYAGNPNGNVASTFVGEVCRDTRVGFERLYQSYTIGNAATAVWIPLGP